MSTPTEASAAEHRRAPLAVSLPAEINSATRTLHTTLNRLITSRLPLALPPHAADPALYTTGLVHFAHVFLTFESLWADLLRDHSPHACAPAPAEPPTSPLLSYLLVNPYGSPSFFTATLAAPTPPSPQLVVFLQNLRPRGLIRSLRVKRDLEHLMDLHPTDLDVVLAKYPGQQVAAFCAHIRQAVHEKPWTLVSYAWCFYMAVFSGGRWIRTQLLQAGDAFWQPAGHESSSAMQLPLAALSLWHFRGQSDGEDIKADFKAQLAAAETLFTPDQRVDIIEEAKNIFALCATLVQELDDMLAAECAPPREHMSLSDANPHEKSILANRVTHSARPADARVIALARRPQVTALLVALACFALFALLKLQQV
ncbi:hypothetical protein ACEQ8H_002267 [Pleosporales sp. CAS-2024a]